MNFTTFALSKYIYMLFLANESGFAIYVKEKIVGSKGKKKGMK